MYKLKTELKPRFIACFGHFTSNWLRISGNQSPDPNS